MAGHESEEREQVVAQDATAAAEASEHAVAEINPAEPDIDDVIARLDTPGNRLPKDAIRDARRLRPQIIPRLIELIQRATEAARRGQEVTTSGAFYALYLLTEFRAKEALPAIIEAMYVPNEADLFGDAITEDLNRMLAVLAADDPEAVEKLIAAKEANMYARWNAANTYKFWVRDGLMTRETAVERLRQHLLTAISDKDTDIIAPLICCLGDYGAVEAEPELKEAFQRKLVDEDIIDERFVAYQIARADENLQSYIETCPPSGISDTIEHLSQWYCFQEKQPPEPTSGPMLMPTPPRVTAPQPSKPKLAPIPTIRYDQPHVGRNDPCPCGSGKKYKKCCALKRPES